MEDMDEYFSSQEKNVCSKTDSQKSNSLNGSHIASRLVDESQESSVVDDVVVEDLYQYVLKATSSPNHGSLVKEEEELKRNDILNEVRQNEGTNIFTSLMDKDDIDQSLLRDRNKNKVTDLSDANLDEANSDESRKVAIVEAAQLQNLDVRKRDESAIYSDIKSSENFNNGLIKSRSLNEENNLILSPYNNKIEEENCCNSNNDRGVDTNKNTRNEDSLKMTEEGNVYKHDGVKIQTENYATTNKHLEEIACDEFSVHDSAKIQWNANEPVLSSDKNLIDKNSFSKEVDDEDKSVQHLSGIEEDRSVDLAWNTAESSQHLNKIGDLGDSQNIFDLCDGPEAESQLGLNCELILENHNGMDYCSTSDADSFLNSSEKVEDPDVKNSYCSKKTSGEEILDVNNSYCCKMTSGEEILDVKNSYCSKKTSGEEILDANNSYCSKMTSGEEILDVNNSFCSQITPGEEIPDVNNSYCSKMTPGEESLDVNNSYCSKITSGEEIPDVNMADSEDRAVSLNESDSIFKEPSSELNSLEKLANEAILVVGSRDYNDSNAEVANEKCEVEMLIDKNTSQSEKDVLLGSLRDDIEENLDDSGLPKDDLIDDRDQTNLIDCSQRNSMEQDGRKEFQTSQEKKDNDISIEMLEGKCGLEPGYENQNGENSNPNAEGFKSTPNKAVWTEKETKKRAFEDDSKDLPSKRQKLNSEDLSRLILDAVIQNVCKYHISKKRVLNDNFDFQSNKRLKLFVDEMPRSIQDEAISDNDVDTEYSGDDIEDDDSTFIKSIIDGIIAKGTEQSEYNGGVMRTIDGVIEKAIEHSEYSGDELEDDESNFIKRKIDGIIAKNTEQSEYNGDVISIIDGIIEKATEHTDYSGDDLEDDESNLVQRIIDEVIEEGTQQPECERVALSIIEEILITAIPDDLPYVLEATSIPADEFASMAKASVLLWDIKKEIMDIKEEPLDFDELDKPLKKGRGRKAAYLPSKKVKAEKVKAKPKMKPPPKKKCLPAKKVQKKKLTEEKGTSRSRTTKNSRKTCNQKKEPASDKRKQKTNTPRMPKIHIVKIKEELSPSVVLTRLSNSVDPGPSRASKKVRKVDTPIKKVGRPLGAKSSGVTKQKFAGEKNQKISPPVSRQPPCSRPVPFKRKHPPPVAPCSAVSPRSRLKRSAPDSESEEETPGIIIRSCYVKLYRMPIIDRLLPRKNPSSDPRFCELCEPKRVFMTKEALVSHLKEIHVGALTVQTESERCSGCDRQYFSTNRLNEHMRTCPAVAAMTPIPLLSSKANPRLSDSRMVEERLQHKCPLCGKRYSLLSALDTHMQSHETDSDPLNIEESVKSPKEKSKTSHEVDSFASTMMIRRSGKLIMKLKREKVFKCTKCSSVYPLQQELTAHMKSHDSKSEERNSPDIEILAEMLVPSPSVKKPTARKSTGGTLPSYYKPMARKSTGGKSNIICKPTARKSTGGKLPNSVKSTARKSTGGYQNLKNRNPSPRETRDKSGVASSKIISPVRTTRRK